jgi:hypothetical protein
MQSLSNPVKMLRDAEKVIRFEVNHTSFSSMKSRFIVTDNTVKQLLESQVPVNRNFLAKILNLKGAFQISLFDQWQSFKGGGEEFELEIGRQAIIKQLGYNDTQIKHFYQQLYGNRFKYHYYKKKGAIKETVARLKAEQIGKPQKQVATLCNLCLDALQAAV